MFVCVCLLLSLLKYRQEIVLSLKVSHEDKYRRHNNRERTHSIYTYFINCFSYLVTSACFVNEPLTQQFSTVHSIPNRIYQCYLLCVFNVNIQLSFWQVWIARRSARPDIMVKIVRKSAVATIIRPVTRKVVFACVTKAGRA